MDTRYCDERYGAEPYGDRSRDDRPRDDRPHGGGSRDGRQRVPQGARPSDARQDERLEELCALEPVPFDARRIKQQTFAKLGIEAGTGTRAGGRRRLSRRLTVMLVAAAIMVVGVPSAFAIGGLIANMGEGGIGFFNAAGTAQGGVDEPTYFASMQADLEKANAPVGQTLDFNGGTITLDTLAVDDNFINAFFTIRYDEPINWDAVLGNDGTSPSSPPSWDQLFFMTALHAEFLVDGEDIVARTNLSSGSDFTVDPYYIDERTIAVMVREVIDRDLPDVFDLTVTLPWGGPPLARADAQHLDADTQVEGSFAVTVDKSAPAALTRVAEPGSYRFETAEGSRELVIERLSLSPFGAVLTLKAPTDTDIDAFAITDDKGNTASLLLRGGVVEWLDDPLFDGEPMSYTFELVGLDPQAQSVTITPVIGMEQVWTDEQRATVDLSQPGAEVAYSDLGGLTLVSREVEDGNVTTTFKPHGYLGFPTLSLVGGFGELVAQDIEGLSLTEGSRVAVASSWYDHANNLVVLYERYYAATDEQITPKTTYSYHRSDNLALDEATALTLPLS